MAESIRKEDWERFRALGNVPPSIREVVLRSWVRSRDVTGVHALNFAPAIAQEELRGIRSRNIRLRKAAQAAVRRAGYMLNDAGAMLLLCDRGGIVMEATGDARVLAMGEENHLRPGGRWEETAIGTNAIGTALHLAKPVSISGVEHFCEAIQRWSCAAAPIHDPTSGRLLGAVDISGPSDESLRQASALSVTLALQIEEALRTVGLQEHKQLIDRLLARRDALGGDEVVVLDRHGRKVWSSAAFDKVGEQFEPGAIALCGLAEDSDGDAHALADRMRQALPQAGVDLISEQGDALGLIVTLRRTPPRRPVAAAPPADDLRALAETGPALRELCAVAARIVAGGVALVIKGAAGSGKETLARALHDAGPLAGRPFEVVDCSLLSPETLRGGFSGPDFPRLSETGGTLVLDEPAEIPGPVQPLLSQTLANLLRAEGVPLQLISLSSRSLSDLLASGGLRADLHFRLAGAVVRLPGLADLRADLPGLIRLFADRYGDRRQGRTLRFTPAAMLRLQAHDWPGNLRELRNLMETLSATSYSGLIDVADLPVAIAQGPGPRREETLRERERAEILNTVAATGGNMTETARRLGISRSTLYLKLDQYGLPRGRRH